MPLRHLTPILLIIASIAAAPVRAGDTSGFVPFPAHPTEIPKVRTWPSHYNSLDEYLQAAAAGESEAQYHLGMVYLKGDGAPRDLKQALFWLSKAADLGEAHAEYTLGVLYSEGYGVPKDLALARKWLSLAAGWNLPEAKDALVKLDQSASATADPKTFLATGKAHLNGAGGTAKNPALAREWFQRAAAQNDPDAQYELALLFKGGIGGARDLVQARALLQAALNGGLLKAGVVLGDIERELGVGRSYTVDKMNKGAQHLPQYAAARLGDTQAQFELGKLLLYGDGVERNTSEAMVWLRKAAESDHRGAQVLLGNTLSRGVDVDQDYAEAARWYLRAAQRGDAEAQYVMGSFYSVGLGVNPDSKESRRWYGAAAKQGNAKAQERLSDDGS